MSENISPEERLFKTNQEKMPSIDTDRVINEDSFFEMPKNIFLKILSINEIKKTFLGLYSIVNKLFNKKNYENQDTALAPAVTFPPFELKDVDLYFVNKVLLLILIFSVLFFGFLSAKQKKNIKTVANSISSINFSIDDQIIEGFKTKDFYLSEIAKRHLFMPMETKEEAKEVIVEAPKEASSSAFILQSLSKQLKIVGVSWGENPRVMINLFSDNKTYFLKKGQKIADTEVFIKDILKKKVILGLKDEEMEIE